MWATLFVVVAIGQVIAILATQIVYETMHLGDTLFILNGGWRFQQGLLPGIDYESFYGGMVEQILALSFELFGPSIRALDYGVLLQFAAVMMLSAAGMVGRVSRLTALALTALLATTMLTRAPLEEWTALTELTAAHSFSYNRLGLSLCFVALFVALLRAPTRPLELLGGVITGGALAGAMLSKSTFAVFVPPVFIALALQRRGIGLGMTALGLLATFLLLDPLAQRFLGTYTYTLKCVAADASMGGFTGAIVKTLREVLTHAIAVAAVIAGLAIAWSARVNGRWAWLASALVMIAALGAVCVTMGPFGLIGHQVVTVGALILLVCYERVRREGAAGLLATKVLALIMLLAIVLPHLANSLLVTAAAYVKRDELLIREGPMAGYLLRYNAVRAEAAVLAKGTPTRNDIMAVTASRIASTGRVTGEETYPVFVDGLDALFRLGEMQKHGIIADNLYSYEFALGAEPVPGYPLWPRLTSPEITLTDKLPSNVDITMILRYGAGQFGSLLRKRMGEDFSLCIKTPIWEIYVRRDAGITKCTE